MKNKITFYLTLLLISGFVLLGAEQSHAQEPVLENYTLSHGGTPGARTDGLNVKLTDKHFGNGTAKARLRFKAKEGSGSLSLRVNRTVGSGEITPALLVFRVEVRGYDSAGAVVYARDLEGFSFGDSRSGEWEEELRDITVGINQLSVVFIGNYE